MTAPMTSRGNGKPHFTRAELQAIHRSLYTAAWQTEAFYEPRKAVIRKLDEFFKDERSHLNLLTR